MSFVTSPLFASGMLDKENFYALLSDQSGTVYVGKVLSEEILTNPAKAVEDGQLKAVAILKKVQNPDKSVSIKPMPIADLSAEHIRLFEKVSRTINRVMEKSTGLMEILPYVSQDQLEGFAEIMISKTSPITGYTPDMVKDLAKKQIEHSRKAQALNMLQSLGYKPDMKALQQSAPVQVSDEYLLKDDDTNVTSALIEAEVTTVDV